MRITCKEFCLRGWHNDTMAQPPTSLLSLPTELRDIIYRLLLSKPVLLDLNHKKNLAAIACQSDENGHFSAKLLSLVLRETCSLLRDEMDDFIRQSSVLSIHYFWRGQLERPKPCPFLLPDFLTNNIHHLRLIIMFNEQNSLDKRWRFEWLRTIKNLTQVRLDFVIPNDHNVLTRDSPALRCVVADILLNLPNDTKLSFSKPGTDGAWVLIHPREVCEVVNEMMCVLPASRSVTW